MSLEIKPVGVDDLWRLLPGAREFFAESKLPGKLNPDHFLMSWRRLLEMGNGCILAAIDEVTGEYMGAIGGSFAPDFCTGDKTATEFFWFARPEHRICGIRLLDRFEAEARRVGCVRIHMIHLYNQCGDKLDAFYQKRGYTHIEEVFTKDL